MKNNDEDDDDDDNTSSGLGGMIVANNTVFVGAHTVHPQRKYTSIVNSNRLIPDYHENTDVIYRMLLSDMNNSIPSSNGSYYGNANKNTNTKSMYA